MRRGIGTYAPVVALALSLVGCAAPVTKRVDVTESDVAREAALQKELALTSLTSQAHRLAAVSFHVATQGASLCQSNTAAWIGLVPVSMGMFDRNWAGTAQRLYGLGQETKASFVVPNSPAQIAGIQSGDEIVEVDGKIVPPKADAQWMARTAAEIERKAQFSLRVRRGEEDKTLTITPARGCSFSAQLVDGDAVNAYADGHAIYVTRGMMRFAENDTELALVLSHEYAHNFMGHADSQRANQALGTLADVLVAVTTGVNTGGAFGNAAPQAYSQEFEAEADYAGLYMMALAGYDYRRAPDFWPRMAVNNPAGIHGSPGASHPSSAYRFKALEATVAEIDRKVSGGKELRPDLKIPQTGVVAGSDGSPPMGDAPGKGAKAKGRAWSAYKGNGPPPGDQP